MTELIKDLDVLFLIKKVKFFHELQSELKVSIKQLVITKCVTVTVDDEHIVKLTEIIETLVNKQQSETAQAQTTAVLSYAAALQSELS